MWFVQITNQIMINPNQIQSKSRAFKSNHYVAVKSNHHMIQSWLKSNRDVDLPITDK